MRILAFCNQPDALLSTAVPSKISTLDTIYTFHFLQGLSTKEPVTTTLQSSALITTATLAHLPNHHYDVILLFKVGVLNIMPENTYTCLRNKLATHGAIVGICETSKHSTPRYDLHISWMGKKYKNTLRAHWGVAPLMLTKSIVTKPTQPKPPLTILVDHCYYGKSCKRMIDDDRTQDIITSLLAYQASQATNPSSPSIVTKHSHQAHHIRRRSNNKPGLHSQTIQAS